MALVTEQRGTGNVASDQLKPDFASSILEVDPSASAVTILSRRAGKMPTTRDTFNWFEDDDEPRFDAINNGAGYSDSATSLVVDNGSYFYEHQLVQVTRTAEIFRVVSVAGNTLTVVRGVGNSGTGVAILDDDELYLLSTAQPQGDTSRPARSNNPSTVTNYTQIVRDPVHETRTMMQSATWHTPHDWPYQVKRNAKEHAKSIELALLFGKADRNTAGSQPRTTTKGVRNFITTNLTDAGGALTEAEFNTFQRTLARRGGDNHALFAGALPISVVNAFAMGKLQTTQGSSTYGLKTTTYVSPFGTQHVVYHRLLEGTKYGGEMWALDLEQIKYRYLAGNGASSDTHLKTNIQSPDEDGRKDELITECGLQFGVEKKHAILYGITS